MKDKLKYIIAGVLLFCISFVGGCYVGDIKTAEAQMKTRMQRVEHAGNNFTIYKDTVTGVHYIVHDYGNQNGKASAMSVLVDADGKPLVSK